MLTIYKEVLYKWREYVKGKNKNINNNSNI